MSKPFLTLKQRIMWRVYTVWAARAALSRTALKVYILAVILWKSTAYVSYGNVLRNAPEITDIGSNARFFKGAFSHTDSTTAVLLLGIILLIAWIFFDLLPSLRKKKEQV
jgi:hypothetical protein